MHDGGIGGVEDVEGLRQLHGEATGGMEWGEGSGSATSNGNAAPTASRWSEAIRACG